MLLSTIIPLYALALVQATALQVDISPRDTDTDCIVEPNITTTWSKNEGLARLVKWNTGAKCVNSTMPDLGTIHLFWLNFLGPSYNERDPDWNTPAINVNLASGQTTAHLAKDTPTGLYILSVDWSVIDEGGTVYIGSHLSPVFHITE